MTGDPAACERLYIPAPDFQHSCSSSNISVGSMQSGSGPPGSASSVAGLSQESNRRVMQVKLQTVVDATNGVPSFSSATEAMNAVALFVLERSSETSESGTLEGQLDVLADCMIHHKFLKPTSRAQTVRLMLLGDQGEMPQAVTDFCSKFGMDPILESSWESARDAVEALARDVARSLAKSGSPEVKSPPGRGRGLALLGRLAGE